MSAPDDMPRDGAGRFTKLVCVNAHDRCYEGGPCPYCEPQQRPANTKGALA